MTPEQAHAHVTVQALLEEHAALRAKICDFLSDARVAPLAMLAELPGVTDPAERESILLYIADWHKTRAIARMTARVHKSLREWLAGPASVSAES
ncbi:MAG TPA: hypothetical protein VKX49_04285 [Bryobacteraceae bacterium]|nr:hypothetical protein [Bryobacteraceae bacterium]